MGRLHAITRFKLGVEGTLEEGAWTSVPQDTEEFEVGESYPWAIRETELLTFSISEPDEIDLPRCECPVDAEEYHYGIEQGDSLLFLQDGNVLSWYTVGAIDAILDELSS